MKDLNNYKISDSEIAGKKIEGRPNPLVSETAAENQAKFDALPKAIAEKMNAGFGAAAENFGSVTEMISEKDSGQSAALAAHIADEKHHVPTHEGDAEYQILGLKADGTAPEWKDYSKMVEERDKVIADAREEFSETVSAADAAFEADRNAFSAEMNEIKSETEQAKADAEDAANAAVSSVTAIAKESEKKVKETADAVSRLAEETLIPVPNYEEDNEKCLKAGYEETEVSLTAVSLSDHMRSAAVAGVLGEVQDGDAVFALDTEAAPGSIYSAEEYTVSGAAVLLFDGTYPNYSRIGSGTGVTVGSGYTQEELSSHSDVCISGNGRLVVHNAVLNTGHAVSEVTYIAVRLYPALPGADVSSYVPNTYSADNDESGMFFKGDVRESGLALTDGTSVTVGNAFLWYAYDASLDSDELPCTVTRIVSPGDISAGTVNALKRSRQMGWFDAKGYTDKFAISKVTVNSSERVYLYDHEGLIQNPETLDITILTAQDEPVDFYISTADTFSVPADTEKLRVDFKKGEAYIKSRTDSKLTRYTVLDWFAGSETYTTYPGYFIYMCLQNESAADVLFSYTAVASVQYAVSQKVDKADGKGLSANDFTDLLKEKLESNDVIGSVSFSDIDNAKTGGIYKVVKGNELAGYLIVSSEFFVSQYYLQGIYDIRSLTEATAVTIPIKFRYFQNDTWTAWKTLASMISESEAEVKTYADAKDGENLTAAKEYAEQKALNAQNSAIETAQSADSEMLLQAKNYADTKDGENLSAAKTYADTKDSETLESAKTYTDTKAAAAEDNAKTFGKQTFAGALQGEKFGGIVRVDDVSALDRRLDTVVSSKNIIPFPYANGTITKNGVIFTVSDDGSITMNGTATSSQGSWLWVGFNIPVKPGCTYTIKNLGENAKYDGTYWNNSTYWLGLNVRDVNSTIITSCTCANSDVSFTVGKEWKTIDISVVLKEGYTADNIVIKPQIEEGTVSTAYAKHVSDLSGVSLKKYGKNLIPYPYISGNSVTTNGITYTVDSSTKAITANGTASATAYFSVLDKAHAILLPPGTYFLSGNEKGVKNAELYLKYTDENSNDKYAVDRGSGVSFTVKNATPASVGISVGAGVTVSNAVFKPQLELGSAKTAFESPGTPETYTVGADGSVANLNANEGATTLLTDSDSVILKTKYSRDLSAAFTEIQNAIIALGGSF